MLWQIDFDQSIFYTGVPDLGRMVVYGQGNLYINQRSYVTSIDTYYWQGLSAGVFDPNNLIGVQNDGQFAHLHAGEFNSLAFIVGVMSTQTGGNIEIYGYSDVDYSSHLYVYVSSDGENWDCISDQYITANSPYTIDCGSSANTFGYVGIGVYDDEGYSACLYVDAVHVRGG